MLFDFRIRPPFKSFLTTGGMFGGHDGSHDPAYIDPYETGKDPIPSADKGDMDLFFQEMEANGIDKAGIIGRNCGPNGFVDNADIREFIQKDPNRFFGFAGIDPNAPDAVDEVTRCIRDWGFRDSALKPDPEPRRGSPPTSSRFPRAPGLRTDRPRNARHRHPHTLPIPRPYTRTPFPRPSSATAEDIPEQGRWMLPSSNK